MIVSYVAVIIADAVVVVIVAFGILLDKRALKRSMKTLPSNEQKQPERLRCKEEVASCLSLARTVFEHGVKDKDKSILTSFAEGDITNPMPSSLSIKM